MLSETSTVKTSALSTACLFPLRVLRFLVALFVCFTALILPYRMRLLWYQWIARMVHLPFRAFGKLARFIMSKTSTENPFEER